MVTQELISYIRSELNRGRSREQIRTTLLSGGGWSDMDISEVFRDIMPLSGGVILPEKQKQVLKPDPTPQPQVPPPVVKIAPTPIAKTVTTTPQNQNTSVFNITNSKKKPHVHMLCSLKIEKNILFAKRLRYVLVVVLFILLGVLGYLLRDNFSVLSTKSISYLDTLISKINIPEKEEVIIPQVPLAPLVPAVEQVSVVDCGITESPDVRNQTTYLKDPVLKCIGENAHTCTPATAIVTSEFFPTNLEIKKEGEVCSVKIMYSSSSSLMDVFNKPLASRFISCPVSVVKNLDTTKENVSFRNSSKDNLTQHGFDIYFYTTLGLFIDNDFDNTKIKALQCSGDYIQSVIESHNLQN